MTLADQQARDRIEYSLGETLFVEAGAGTGKTHQLVQRIVNLIATGVVHANEIAAITFTEKAAAELYDRVLEELDQQRQSATDPAPLRTVCRRRRTAGPRGDRDVARFRRPHPQDAPGRSGSASRIPNRR